MLRPTRCAATTFLQLLRNFQLRAAKASRRSTSGSIGARWKLKVVRGIRAVYNTPIPLGRHCGQDFCRRLSSSCRASRNILTEEDRGQCFESSKSEPYGGPVQHATVVHPSTGLPQIDHPNLHRPACLRCRGYRGGLPLLRVRKGQKPGILKETSMTTHLSPTHL